MMMDGRATDEKDERGQPLAGDTLLFIANAGDRSRSFTAPSLPAPGRWREIVHTARTPRALVRGRAVHVAPHSCLLLRLDRLA